jgi:hypothetical protein
MPRRHTDKEDRLPLRNAFLIWLAGGILGWSAFAFLVVLLV